MSRNRWSALILAVVGSATSVGGAAAAPAADEPKSTGWVEESKQEPAGTRYRTFHSKTVDARVSYLVYLPPGYDDGDRRYPVIYWLHGMTNDQRKGAGFVRRLDRAIRDGRAPAAIAILVNGRTHSYYCDSPDGRTPVESVIVKDLIPHVDETYRTKSGSETRAVEGYSMGGFGAAHLGFKFPETFGVVSILAGALHEAEDFAERESKAYREAFGADRAYFEKNSPWTLAKSNADDLGDTRIRIVVGDKDPVYGGNKAFHQRLEELKIEHEFRVMEGATHDYEKLYDGLGDRAFGIYRKAWGEPEGRGSSGR